MYFSEGATSSKTDYNIGEYSVIKSVHKYAMNSRVMMAVARPSTN